MTEKQEAYMAELLEIENGKYRSEAALILNLFAIIKNNMNGLCNDHEHHAARHIVVCPECSGLDDMKVNQKWRRPV